MKVLAVAVFLVAATALAAGYSTTDSYAPITDGGVVHGYCDAGVCNHVALDGGGEGLSLQGVQGLRVRACADQGWELGSTGWLDAWVCRPTANVCTSWSRSTLLDLSIAPGPSGSPVGRCWQSPDLSVAFSAAGWRAMWTADRLNVTDGGLSVTVDSFCVPGTPC